MQIYGIDLSKEKFDVCFSNFEEVIQLKQVKNSYKGINEFLSELDNDAELCIEHTGIYGDMLVFLANLHRIKIYAVSGYEVKHSLGLIKGKSDPIDATRLREYAIRFYDKLKEAFYVSENMHELRELHSLRHLLVKQKQSVSKHSKEKSIAPFCSMISYQTSCKVIQTMEEQIRLIEKQINDII